MCQTNTANLSANDAEIFDNKTNFSTNMPFNHKIILTSMIYALLLQSLMPGLEHFSAYFSMGKKRKLLLKGCMVKVNYKNEQWMLIMKS